MNYFECCHGCVAPKRYPGCSGKCPEYAEGKARQEADKAKMRIEEDIRNYKLTSISQRMDNDAKRKRKTRPYNKL